MNSAALRFIPKEDLKKRDLENIRNSSQKNKNGESRPARYKGSPGFLIF
jgi:hypothetical protein